MKLRLAFTLCFFLTLSFIATAQDKGDPKLTEIWTPVPAKITPGKVASEAPSDAFVLFGKTKDSANWKHENGKPFNWTVTDSFFSVLPSSGGVVTKKSFGDCQLHIEWRTPAVVKGEGQGRGNSGIFFMGRYELQVLDSYDNVTYSNGQAGSIYKQKAPAVNVCRQPGEWQTYDVLFTAPVFKEDGSLKSPAKITVFQNGVMVQYNFELWGGTTYIGIAKYVKHAAKEPIMLQDHGNPTSFRNIWIREL